MHIDKTIGVLVIIGTFILGAASALSVVAVAGHDEGRGGEGMKGKMMDESGYGEMRNATGTESVQDKNDAPDASGNTAPNSR
jgi:hypothetical protein